MRYIFLLWCLLMILLCSCRSSRQRWEDKGVKEGWIKPGLDSLQATVKPDSAGTEAAVTEFTDSVAKIIYADCPGLQTSTKTKIKYLTKTVFVPRFLQKAFPDTAVTQNGITTAVWFDSAGKMKIKTTAAKQTIVLQDDQFWIGFLCGLASWIGFGVFCVLYWFFKK